MKDFLENEKKMCRHTHQIITPIYNAQKAFKDTNIYKTMNYPAGIIYHLNKSPFLKNLSVLKSLNTYCLPNSLINTTSVLKDLSNGLVMLATGTNSVFAARTAINNLIEQQQKLKETVERFRLINQIFDEYYPIFDENLINKISRMRKKDSKSLKKCIINYYKKNKYENILKGYEIISDKKFIQNRIHILESCIKSMTKLPQKDRYNLIIPTLTAQITGLLEDCIKLIPKDYQPSSPDLKERKLLLDYANNNFKFMYSMALQNIIEKTFCRTDKFKQLPAEEQEKYNKIRPGILHGDTCCLDYGTEKNLILSWLELFLLVKIGEYLSLFSCLNS